MSTGKIITTHRLDNGLEITLLDQSKQIAADRWYICIKIQTAIPLEDKWFAHHPINDLKFQEMRQTFGDTVLFEQKRERNFVGADEKEAIVKDICETSLQLAKRYFSHADFAAKAILKQFTESNRQF